MYRMSLFARRTLQSMLNDNASFMSHSQLQRHVGALNDESNVTLPTEWEISILHAISRFASIKHEPDLGGRARIDIYCTIPSQSLEFAADITTVSDQGYEKDNPLKEFYDILTSRAFAVGVDPGCLFFEVGGDMVGKRSAHKMKLKLPPRGELSTYVKREISPFFQQITNAPHEKHRWKTISESVEIIIDYDPAERYSSMTYPSYTVAYSNTHNPVARAINSKADQLKESGFAGMKGLFLCDGGSATMGDSSRLRTIINAALRRRTTLDFVIAVTVDDRGPRDARLSVEFEIYMNPRQTPAAGKQLTRFVDELTKTVVKPVEKPSTVVANHRREFFAFTPFYTSWGLSGNSFTFPLRVLREILAGKLAVETFHQHHWFREPPGEESLHFFKVMHDLGYTISNIRIEPAPNRDDDWVTFEFAGPDPAVAPFSVPAQTGIQDR